MADESKQEQYTIGQGAGAVNMARRTAQIEGAFFLPYLRELGTNLSIIDCGCGPGTITVGLSKEIAEGQVVGIDISDTAIAQANAHAQSEHATNVKFETGSIYELPFPDNNFDAAFSNGVLEHLNSPLKAIQEMRRVVKPGGIIAVRAIDVSTYIWSPTNDLLDQTVPIIRNIAEQLGGDPFVGRNIRGLMRKAGLWDVVGTSSTFSCGSNEETYYQGILWSERFATGFNGSIDSETAENISKAWAEWGKSPDAFWSQTYCEATGRKE